MVRRMWICALGTGLSADQFMDAIDAKMVINEARVWPKPEDQDPDKAIEHIK